MIYKITKDVKQGGIWDGKKLVKEFETEDVTLAEHFKKQGCKVEQLAEKTLEQCTVPQLKKYAKEHNIDLGESTSKEDILKIILEAEQASSQ